LEVYASGVLFDYLNRTAGAQIALEAVTLPSDLLNKIEGSFVDGGLTIKSTNDIEREFAFGYWSENNDGGFIYYWHPVCKLIPTEENRQTRTADIQDPARNYSIRIMPFNNHWHINYSTKKEEDAGYAPLQKEEFFINPIYSLEQLPTRKPLDITAPPTYPQSTNPDDD